MTPVRLAVIGAGDVAQRDYLPEAHRLGDLAEIVIICGRSPERARRVAGQFGIARWSADYREALAADVDAVVNLTPVPVHEEVTRAALAAGLHVYTEKPLAVTAARARALAGEATERGLVLVCAPSVMLYPQLAAVVEILRAGDLGTVCSARAHALGGVPPWEGYDSDPAPFFSAESGPLIDMAVYPLHALTGLLGPVRRVAAMSRRTRQSFTITAGPLRGQVVPVEADDQWQLVLDLGSCIASVEVNFATAPSAAAECELRGDAGAVAFSLLDVAAPVTVLRPGAAEFTELLVAAGREGGPDHILGVVHLAECISAGLAPVASAAHAIHVLDVIEAARLSASSGQAVSIKSTAGLRLAEPTSAGGA